MINDILVSPLKIIKVDGGDVLHGLKKSDESYVDFGEAYFSKVSYRAIKAWKRHLHMTSNLIVPIGNVKFVFASDSGEIRVIQVGQNNYMRLSVPPKIWFGFQGLSEHGALILNISDIEHDPDEVERKSIADIKYDWSE